MRRILIGSAIAASLVFTGCAVPSDSESAVPASQQQTDRPVAPPPVAPSPAATVAPGPDPSAIRVVPQPVDAPAPQRIGIPGVGEIPIDPVGVEADGEAEIPEDVSRVGWYEYGSAPGDGEGAVVLMGHRDGQGSRGALFNLGTVPIGSTLVVSDAAGTQHQYRITSNESISKQVVPLADLFTRTGAPSLVLISCGGEYIKEQGGYLDNVVVVAEPI